MCVCVCVCVCVCGLICMLLAFPVTNNRKSTLILFAKEATSKYHIALSIPFTNIEDTILKGTSYLNKGIYKTQHSFTEHKFQKYLQNFARKKLRFYGYKNPFVSRRITNAHLTGDVLPHLSRRLSMRLEAILSIHCTLEASTVRVQTGLYCFVAAGPGSGWESWVQNDL